MVGRAGSFQSSRLIVFALLLFTVAGLLAPCASAQLYFGQNKVQYTDFDWQMMTTEHFNIYFYTEEAEIAQIAARIAEDSYPRLAAKFNQEVSKKIPLIVYSSPSYFSQTNVIPGILPESVGGFTEFLKGRVVVPFHGSYFDFKHVITHELVHVFTIAKLEEISSRQGVIRMTGLPLWFTEGLAEYWSEDWDTEADMIVKDMVLRGDVLPMSEFWKVQGSYFMYKLGQSACKFISEAYGPEKLVLILENWNKGRSFEEVVQVTLGKRFNDVSDEWQYWLKKKYYPELENLGLPRMESNRLTWDGYCVKGVPISWDDGHGLREWVVFMAYRRGYTGIYMKPRKASKQGLRTLVKGERSSKFESLHLLRSGIDATNAGLVVFSSKSKEQDVIYVYSLKEDRIVGEYRLEDLVAARSPRFSSDGRQIVFSGIQKSGYSDIYLLDISSGKISTVTNDIYNDVDPVFSLDGRRIVFASDRCDGGDMGANSLFELELADPTNIRQLTWGHFNDQTPEVSTRGVFFSSDREGSYNLFLLDPDGLITRQSDFATGAFDPRIESDGSHIVYTGYEDFQFRVYEKKLSDTVKAIANITTLGHSTWAPRQIDRGHGRSSVKYKTDYSFDIAQSAVAYDPIYGSAGGLQASFSDILGNHAYYLLLTNSAENKDDLLQSFNFGVTYVNRAHRLNWGVGAFHLYDEYYDRRDLFYFERQAGVLGYFSYPVSRFSRFDITSFIRYDKKDRRYGLVDREALLASTFMSWVYDNSIWDISGPIEGRRYNLSVGLSQSISDGMAWNRIGLVDLRHYVRLGTNSAIASRLFAFGSGGVEPQRIYFGGSWDFRGYDRRAFYNRKVLFASNELRFPLIDDLIIGMPFGAIGFRGIRGAAFFDTGSAWDDKFDQFLGSYGFGFRVNVAYVVLLRFDFARRTDFKTTSPGFDFDFFFGWNF